MLFSFSTIDMWDQKISIWIQRELASPELDWVFRNITDLHYQIWFVSLVVLPLLGYWILRERRKGAIKALALILTLMMVDGLCGQWVKPLFARPRPFISDPLIIQKSPASGFSFVSNHAANMFALAVFMGSLYPRTRWVWFISAVVVCWSRIYNGVHYFSDVISGALIGSVVSLITVQILKRNLKGQIETRTK